MTARSLGLSIDEQGRFDPRPYTTVAEAYYFGISFFEETGAFGNETGRDRTTVLSDSGGLLSQRGTGVCQDEAEDQADKKDPCRP